MLLAVPKTKPYGDRSFDARAPRLWNSPPVAIKNSESLNSFKSKLKRLLFRLCYRLWRSYYWRVSRLLLSLLFLLCIEYKQYEHLPLLYSIVFLLFFFRNVL